MDRVCTLAYALPPDRPAETPDRNSLILDQRELAVECCAAFVCVRRFVLATNASSVLWLVVAAAAMFSMYVSICGSMSEAVVGVAWVGAWSMGPAVFVLLKATPCCFFALLAQIGVA